MQNLSGVTFWQAFYLDEKSLKSKLIQFTFKSFFGDEVELDVRNKKLFNVSEYSTIKGFLQCCFEKNP
jgi:hypothetical protein